MSISISMRDIQKRCRRIEALLSTLREGARLTCSIGSGGGARSRVLVAHEGPLPRREAREIRFRLAGGRLWANYFEIWSASDESKQLDLFKAYLTLFRAAQEGRADELIAIHCDPSEDGPEPATSYKRGPHLHVIAASDPIPRVHFALDLGQLELLLSSLDELETGWKRLVRMLKVEVVDRF